MARRVVAQLRAEQLTNCPAFCDTNGYLLSVTDIEEIIHPILEELQGRGDLEGVLPSNMDVQEKFRCYRSFRRGAASTAKNIGIKENTITLVHRWSKFEAREGKQPGFRMMEHYLADYQVRAAQLSFSSRI